MKQRLYIAVALLVAAGCNKVAKIDNPVAPEPPPRITFENEPITPDAEEAAQFASRDDLPADGDANEIPTYEEVKRASTTQMTSATAPIDADLGNATGTLVLVNGEPIFAEDVLQEFAQHLANAEKHGSPEDVRKLKAEIFRRRLPMHIQSKLLSTALLKSLDDKKKELLKKGMQDAFAASLEQKKKELNISSRGELEVALAKEGLTMQRLEQAFNEKQMAQLYVTQNAGTPPKFSRSELFDYYQQHIEEYAVEGKVKWREIKIDFAARGGEPVARQDMAEIEQQLINGADFGELAKKASDGITALDGGIWDWTTVGSLVDEKLEAILFQLPPGTVSDVIGSDDSYQIVQVVERIDPGYVPFEDVHEKIKMELRDVQFQESAKKLVEELKETAVIEPKYDFGDITWLP